MNIYTFTAPSDSTVEIDGQVEVKNLFTLLLFDQPKKLAGKILIISIFIILKAKSDGHSQRLAGHHPPTGAA